MKELAPTQYSIESTFKNPATHSCSVYDGHAITGESNKIARRAYEALGIEYPVQVIISYPTSSR